MSKELRENERKEITMLVLLAAITLVCVIGLAGLELSHPLSSPTGAQTFGLPVEQEAPETVPDSPTLVIEPEPIQEEQTTVPEQQPVIEDAPPEMPAITEPITEPAEETVEEPQTEEPATTIQGGFSIQEDFSNETIFLMWNNSEYLSTSTIAFNDIVFDKKGNIVATAKNNSRFTVKYDENGTKIWEDNYFVGTNNDEGQALAIDSQNRIISAGIVQNPAPSAWYSSLLQYDENGTLLWDLNSSAHKFYGVTVDSQDYIYAVGVREYSSPNNDDMLIIKYDENGTTVWGPSFRTWDPNTLATNYVYGADVEVDSAGNPIVAVRLDDNFTIIKYNGTNGNTLWIKDFYSGATADYTAALEIDSEDNIIVVGRNYTAGIMDLIVIKFNSSGDHIWNFTLPETTSEYAAAGVDIDDMDNIIITGNNLTGSTKRLFLAKLNSSGDLGWSYTEYYTTPYVGFSYGSELAIEDHYIAVATNREIMAYFFNNNATQTEPMINTTSGTNKSDENLTLHPQNVSDANGDLVANITNWFVDGQSLTVLNLPFETRKNLIVNNTVTNDATAKDYSPYQNNGTLGANITEYMPSTGAEGIIGRSYAYNGEKSFVNVKHSESLNLSQFTIEGWFKPSAVFNSSSGHYRGILDKGNYQLFLDKEDGKLKFSIDSNSTKNWSEQGAGVLGNIISLSVWDEHLYAAGTFTQAGGISANRTARWNGTDWTALGHGMSGNVAAFASWKGELYAGGLFQDADQLNVNNTAKWDGTSWTKLGAGTDNEVMCFAEWNGELYAGGQFTQAGGSSANHIAKWNGTAWSPLGTGINGAVYALAVWNGELYAGGQFTQAGGSSANHIAKWNGTAWSQLDAFGIGSEVYTITPYNSSLYVGGAFTTAGGSSANYIAKWNRTSWTTVGNGMSSTVNALVVWNGELYAGGKFAQAGGNTVNYAAKWNGTNWLALDAGTDSTIYSMVVWNGELYAGGQFTQAGGSSANRSAKWSSGDEKELSSNTSSWPVDWSHFAITANSSDMSIYVNGTLENSITLSEPILKNTKDLLIGTTYGARLGGSSSSGAENFGGYIDELKIYNRVLSEEQIAANYNNGTANPHIIVSEETLPGEVWYAEVTPNDGWADGITNVTSNMTIQSGQYNLTLPEGIYYLEPGTPPIAGNFKYNFSIMFENLTTISGNILGCYVNQSNCFDTGLSGCRQIFVNETLSTSYNNENKSITHVIDSSDIINSTLGGTTDNWIPWRIESCGVYDGGLNVINEDNTTWRVHVHPISWTTGDIANSVNAKTAANQFFQNTIKADNDGDITFAVSKYGGTKVELYCQDGTDNPDESDSLVDCNDPECDGITYSCLAKQDFDNDTLFYSPSGSHGTLAQDIPDGDLARNTTSATTFNTVVDYTMHTMPNGTFKMRFRRWGLSKTATIFVDGFPNITNATKYAPGSTSSTGELIYFLDNNGNPQDTDFLNSAQTYLNRVALRSYLSGGTEIQNMDTIVEVRFDDPSSIDMTQGYILELTFNYVEGSTPYEEKMNITIYFDDPTYGSPPRWNNSNENESEIWMDHENISWGPCNDTKNADFDLLNCAGNEQNCFEQSSYDCYDNDCNDFSGPSAWNDYTFASTYGTCSYFNESQTNATCFDSYNNDWATEDTTWGHANTGLTLVDCRDIDCDQIHNGSIFCEYNIELTCTDLFDNDMYNQKDCDVQAGGSYNDSEYDCSSYCRSVDANHSIENGSECDDGIDNDWDLFYRTDWTVGAGPYNYSYNDSINSGMDCHWGGYYGYGSDNHPDEDCDLSTMGNTYRCELTREINCIDGFDNDYDNEASGMPHADWSLNTTEYSATFGISFSDDADFDDYDCANHASVPVSEATNASWCFDGIDNDLDEYFWNSSGYFVNNSEGRDCSDPDCTGVSNPANSSQTCSIYEYNSTDNYFNSLSSPDLYCADSFDNDNDNSLGWPNGGIDCTDPDCNKQFNLCYACPEKENATWDACADSTDNDYDMPTSYTDCADADCNMGLGSYNHKFCEYQAETLCSDSFDNDADSSADCADSDCNGQTGPEGQTCEPAGETSCNDDFDNDGDSLIDCSDSDCQPLAICNITTNMTGSYTPPTTSSSTYGNVLVTWDSRVRNGSAYTINLNRTSSYASASLFIGSLTGSGMPNTGLVVNTAEPSGGFSVSGPNASQFEVQQNNSAGAKWQIELRDQVPSSTVNGFDITVSVPTNETLGYTSWEYYHSIDGTPSTGNTVGVIILDSIAPSVQNITVEPTNRAEIEYNSSAWVGILAIDPENGDYNDGTIDTCYYNVSGPGGYLSSGSSTSTCTFTFSDIVEEGTYTINAWARDDTGNTAVVSAATKEINLTPKYVSGSFSLSDRFHNETPTINVTALFQSDDASSIPNCSIYYRNSTSAAQYITNATATATGDTVNCSGSITIPSADEMYEIWIKITDSEGDSEISESETFFVCQNETSTGTGTNSEKWSCIYRDLNDDSVIDVCEANDPNITLISPVNNTENTTTKDIRFEFNVTDEREISNCSLIINNEVNQTNNSINKLISPLLFVQYLEEGQYNWSISCTDDALNPNEGTSEIRNITIAVNDAPQLNNSNLVPNVTISEDGYDDTINLSEHFYELDGDDMNYTAVYSPNITITIDNNSGTVNITTDANYSGVQYAVFNASDPSGKSNVSNNITINITPVNDAPSADFSSIDPVQLVEDNYNDTINLSLYVADVDNTDEQINWTCTDNETDVTSTENNNTKILNISSTNNFTGTANITCTGFDLEPLNDTHSFIVNVTPVNDPPVANLSNLTYMIIAPDSYDDSTNLSLYVTDVDNTVEEINWSCYTNESDVPANASNVTKYLNVSSSNDFSGIVEVNCTASDIEGLTSNTSFLVNLTPVSTNSSGVVVPNGLYEPLCCSGGQTGTACLGSYNEATGSGDLYCSDNSSVENYVLHTVFITVQDVTIGSSSTLGCLIERSDYSTFLLNVTGITLTDQDYTLNHTFSKTDEDNGWLNETTTGVNIPWYVHNCSIRNSAGQITSSQDVNRRIYVHKSRPWTDTDLTLAVGCESSPNRLFNNTAMCNRTAGAIASSKEFGFAFKRYAQSGVEADCYDGSASGNDPGETDENDTTCQTWWDNYTTPTFYGSYGFGTRSDNVNVITGAGISDWFIKDTTSNLDVETLMSGTEQTSFEYTIYTEPSPGGAGEFKARIRTAATRTSRQYNLVINNLPIQANGTTIIGQGLPSNQANYIVSLDDTGGKKTFAITCSHTDCESSSPIDIIVEIEFNESFTEAGRQLTFEMAWTGGSSASTTGAVSFGTAGLSNNDENETDGAVGVNSCSDAENNDLDISTTYTYINGLSPFNQISYSRDCADPDCATEQGPSYTAEQDYTFNQSTCEYRTEASCGDNYDNDFNDNFTTDAYGLQGYPYTDCHDIDCFGNGVECPTSETICNNNLNDDWDYVNTESEASFKIGESGNNNVKYDHTSRTANLMDCEDPDCDTLQGGTLATQFCNWGHEINCSDAFDNDALQTYDCQSSGSSYGTVGSSAPAYGHLEYDCSIYCRSTVDSNEKGAECDDGVDNDWDYWDNSSYYSGTANSTGGGIDCGWNGSGLPYNPDTECHLETMGNGYRCELGTELTCTDSFDNDYDDGHTTDGGWSASLYNSYFSQFGMSYSENADCDDYDCAGLNNCPTSENPGGNYPAWCFDGADNDLDGSSDCSDSDCAGAINPGDPTESCVAYELNSSLLLDGDNSTNSVHYCGNNVDDENKASDNSAAPTFAYNSIGFTYTGDRSSKMDCNDLDCRQEFGQCAPCSSNEFVEWDSCFDSIDNDHDSSTDTADADCTGKLVNARGFTSSTNPSSETASGASCMNQYNDDSSSGSFLSDPVDECGDSDCDNQIFSPDGRTCSAVASEASACTDDFDNDGDGSIDCYDSNCYSSCGISAYGGEGILYSPSNASATIVTGKISLSYPVRIRLGEPFAVVITYITEHSTTDTSDVTIGSQANPIPTASFNASDSSCPACAGAGLTFDTSQAGTDSLLMVHKTAGGTVAAGTSVTVYVNPTSPANVLNSTNVKYSAQFSGTPGDYTEAVEVLNNITPSLGGIQIEPSGGNLTTGDQIQVIGSNFTSAGNGTQTNSGRAGRCNIVISGPVNANVNDNDCDYAWIVTESGTYTVTITPYDSTGLAGTSVVDSLVISSVAPKVISALSRSAGKRAHFSTSNSSFDSFDDSFNSITGTMTASFTTDTNYPYIISSCSAIIRNSTGSVVATHSITGTAGSTTTCTVDASIAGLPNDGLYTVTVNATDGRGYSLETQRVAFFVCNNLTSSASDGSWNCSQADFDADGYTEGIYLPFNYSSGATFYQLSCDSCPGQTNVGKDGDGDGYDNVCDPVCGDGLVEGVEECDDGNTNDGDGCSATCTDETGITPSGGGGGGTYRPQTIVPTPDDKSGMCIEDWVCDEWSRCLPEGFRTRPCYEWAHCGTDVSKPLTVASCIFISPILDKPTVEVPAGPICGNGVCEAPEDYILCPADCPRPPAPDWLLILIYSMLGATVAISTIYVIGIGIIGAALGDLWLLTINALLTSTALLMIYHAMQYRTALFVAYGVWSFVILYLALARHLTVVTSKIPVNKFAQLIEKKVGGTRFKLEKGAEELLDTINKNKEKLREIGMESEDLKFKKLDSKLTKESAKLKEINLELKNIMKKRKADFGLEKKSEKPIIKKTKKKYRKFIR